jgi:hypothetical protein
MSNSRGRISHQRLSHRLEGELEVPNDSGHGGINVVEGARREVFDLLFC